MMLHRHLYESILLVLLFISAHAAIAQSEKTTNQSLQVESGAFVSPNVSSPAENSRQLRDRWVPPDIDTTRPSVAPNVSCSLPDVVSRAGTQIQKLVQKLDRLSATEVIKHENVSRTGNLKQPEIQKFNYVLSIKERPDGYLDTEEYRSSGRSSPEFLSGIDTENIPSIVLAFHPNYVSKLRLDCEGLGTWRGQSAWQIRFEVPCDSSFTISSIRIGGKKYTVRFRGRAWFLTDSYQLVHLEMDLAEIIPSIRLRLYHQVFEFRSVSFPTSGAEFWLPSSAEMYIDFKGHRFYRRHSYVDFKLFFVKVQQQSGDLQ